MIISTVQGGGNPTIYTWLKTIEVANINLYEITYEGGSSFFTLYA